MISRGRRRVRPSSDVPSPATCAHYRAELWRGHATRSKCPPALAYHLSDGPRADRRQLATEVLGNGQEERLDHLGRATELRPKVVALGRYAGRTRVEVALPRHVAPDRDERRRAESELFGAEERGHEQVPAGLEAAIGSERHAITQAVAEQDLVDLGQPELPWCPDVLDR